MGDRNQAFLKLAYSADDGQASLGNRERDHRPVSVLDLNAALVVDRNAVLVDIEFLPSVSTKV